MDLKFALRSLRKSPGFTALAVLVMALGMGANTAVFSVVNAVLLRPLGYRDPDRIVVLTSSWKKGVLAGALSKQVSALDAQDWHDQSSAFQWMAYYATTQASVLAGEAAAYGRVTQVTPEFFRVFGIEPAAGRIFPSSGTVVISHAYWRSQFEANPSAIGRSVRMFERTFTVAGIMPEGFNDPVHSDLWLPIEMKAQKPEYRAGLNYECIARLKPGVSVEQAQAQLTSIATRLTQQYPNTNEGRGVSVTRLRDETVSEVRTTLYLLLGAVGVVLLIACANVATLLLAKATGRAREMAIRAAVGATRGRILRQLITESLVLSVMAGGVGLVVAIWGSKALVALAPAGVPRLASTSTDGWVLMFNFAMAVVASLLFGLVPAIHASRTDLNQMLRRGAGSLNSMRSALVIAEIAMSVILLAGAGLLMKSFIALRGVTLGFQPENVLVMKTTVPASSDSGTRRANQFFKGLLADMATLPGVEAAGATTSPPGHIETSTLYWIDRIPKQLDMSGTPALVSVVAPGTFHALGIPLKQGRDFNDSDGPGTPFTVIVNDALVRKSFAGQDPIGRTIFCPSDSLDGMKIAGVVGDVRQEGPAYAPQPECYMPYQQHRYNGTTLSVVVKTAGDPRGLMDSLRKMVANRSPEVSVDFTTMGALLAGNVAPDWFRTLLLGIFAGLAVCLAMAGVYGVMAYLAAQRTSEIGLRMALGASPGNVLRLILGQGMTLAMIGVALGLAGAFSVSRLLTSMLFEVKPGDPAIYASVAAMVAAVSFVASYLPARAAASVDPLVALRNE